MKLSRYLLLVALVKLSACGFHLRGSQDLSAVLPEVRVAGISLHGELGRELQRSLKQANVVINEVADVVFQVSNESTSKRVLAVDSAGRASQYELSYSLSFRLFRVMKEKKETKDILGTQTITVKREYLFDQSKLLAKADEEAGLVKSMREDAMVNLLRRLHFSLRKKAKVE